MNELKHYGVKGMKWGKRSRRISPNTTSFGRKRTDKKIAAKKEALESGNYHMRRGATKKRTEAFRQKDIKRLSDMQQRRQLLRDNRKTKVTKEYRPSLGTRRNAAERIIKGKNTDWESAVRDSERVQRNFRIAMGIAGTALVVNRLSKKSNSIHDFKLS